MSRQRIQKIILVGCGIHYQEKYHAVLQTKNIEIVLLIDLKSKEKQIRDFFLNSSIQPRHVLFLNEAYRNALPQSQIEILTAGLNLAEADGVLICTEPKIRKPYVLWAACRGWDIFMDKPVTAFFHPERIATLETDFEEMLACVHENGVRAVVSCQRRAHIAYLWLTDYLKTFISKYGVPLTGIDIHFAGGVWKTPREYLEDQNHPFNYGYGILLHSGYHYVDLLVHFLGLNEILFPASSRLFHVMASQPLDQFSREGSIQKTCLEEDYRGFGEIDFMMMGQVFKEKRVMTNYSLKLFGTSLSTRLSCQTAPKLQGRVRQEKIILHFGHLASVHVTCLPVKKLAPDQSDVEDITITVMNSPLLKDQKSFRCLRREDFSKMHPRLPVTASMNGFARKWQLAEFLEGRDGYSPLDSHRDTMMMLKNIYLQLQQRTNSIFPNQADESKALYQLCAREN